MRKNFKLLILVAVILTAALLFGCSLVKRELIVVTKAPTETQESAETTAPETDAETTDAPAATSAPATAAPTAKPTAKATATVAPTNKPIPTANVTSKTSTIHNVKYTYKYSVDYFETFNSKNLGSRVQKSTPGVTVKTTDSNVSLPKTYVNNWANYAQTAINYQCDISTAVTFEFGDYKLITDAKNVTAKLVTPNGTENISVTSAQFSGRTNIDVVITFQNDIIIYANRQKICKFDCDSASDVTKAYTWKFSCEGSGTLEKVNIYNCGKYTETQTISAVSTNGSALGLDITNKTDLVGMCYSMWFDDVLGTGTAKVTSYKYNVTNLLSEGYSFSKSKGFTKSDGSTCNLAGEYYYWAEPAQGYYRSSDKSAHRKNLELLEAAGVDFLVLDYTYASTSGWLPGTVTWTKFIEGPMTALLDTIMEMRAEGKETPYIVLWPNNYVMFDALEEYFISKDKWKDCFVYWSGKPFMLYWNAASNKTETAKYSSTFTLRAMYGLQNKVSTGQWSFLEHNNNQTVSYDSSGKAEHMTCCVAAQRDYMSNTSTAQGRDGGNFWYKQWKNVFAVHPKIVTVTWWNEWCAQMQSSSGYAFTDNFNQEYSRDIEPMKGGHGDQYYQWLIKYVKAYKNHESCPKLTEN